MIILKRIYDKPENSDGFRVLVDRLWPRGISKERAQLDLWLKEIAPSTELRQWFNHDSQKWAEFKIRYRRELETNSAVPVLQALAREKATVTLLFASKDVDHNEAIVLYELLHRGELTVDLP